LLNDQPWEPPRIAGGGDPGGRAGHGLEAVHVQPFDCDAALRLGEPDMHDLERGDGLEEKDQRRVRLLALAGAGGL
jgi:hypothetical protein